MKPRERVIRSIRFAKPDRLPICYVFSEGFVQKYANELNKFLKNYPSDFGPANFQIQEKGETYPREYRDEWGCVWEDLLCGIMGQVKEHPIRKWAQLKDFRIPSLPWKKKEEFKNLEKRIGQTHKRGYYAAVWGPFRGGFNLFERMQWLRGTENLLIDLVENKFRVKELAEIITEEYLIKGARYLIKAGVDGFYLADDWGAQKNLLISPRLWRDIFRPQYQRVIQFVHSQGVDIIFHSDGYIMEIIPDLIEMGVDVLYPQFSCLSLQELAKICKGKICIFTDVDRQHLLPFGEPEEIESYIEEMVTTLASPQGGLILRGYIGPDVPLRNVKAMYEAFWEYGRNYKVLAGGEY